MSASSDQRIQRLKETLAERILVLDGAMGTLIQAKNLKAADFVGRQRDPVKGYSTLAWALLSSAEFVNNH